MQVNQPKEGGAEHSAAVHHHQHPALDVPEKRCNKCDEHWPADTEFFYRQAGRPDGLGSICKACYSETPSVIRRNERKARRAEVPSAWELLFVRAAQEADHA